MFEQVRGTTKTLVGDDRGSKDAEPHARTRRAARRAALPSLVVLALAGCGDDSSADGGGSSGAESSGGSSGGTMTAATDTTDAADSTGGSTTAPVETDTEGAEPELTASCDGVSLLPRPADTAARGPWTVGVRTVPLDGLTVEVWYPAQGDPPDGVEPVVYDIRDSLPESEQTKISDEDNPWQYGTSFRDLPIDAEHGPYPVVLFVHGTAGFRTQSLPFMEHWASRGFVVMAADHPGLWMHDLLSLACGQGSTPQDLQADLATMVSAVRGEIGGLEDFGDRLDGDRIGTTGHSAGGNAVSSTGDVAQVVIPMAAGGVDAGATVVSSLVLGALQDAVVAFPSQQDGYDSTRPRKRLVGIANTGHLAFAQLCSLRNAADEDLVTIAENNGVCGVGLAGGLFQCDPTFLPDEEGWEIVHFASSAVLEETLHCEPAAVTELENIKGRYPIVLEFEQEL